MRTSLLLRSRKTLWIEGTALIWLFSFFLNKSWDSCTCCAMLCFHEGKGFKSKNEGCYTLLLPNFKTLQNQQRYPCAHSWETVCHLFLSLPRFLWFFLFPSVIHLHSEEESLGLGSSSCGSHLGTGLYLLWQPFGMVLTTPSQNSKVWRPQKCWRPQAYMNHQERPMTKSCLHNIVVFS